MILETLLAVIAFGAAAGDASSPGAGTAGHYAALSSKVETPPPFASVDFICGPREDVRNVPWAWWQLEVRASDDANAAPLVQVRALTSRNPFAIANETIQFERYLVRIPQAHETLDYRDIHTGRALLPGWGGFQVHFVPRPARASARQASLPETCEYLGHVLALHSVAKDARWDAWDDAKVLNLDPELLVGTARGFKDTEGHRLPQTPNRQEYTYVPFTEEDFRAMFDAGFNVFWVDGEKDRFVRASSVFYIRGLGAGATVLQYPADLYRSNYLGPAMFMDEPAIFLFGDQAIQKSWRHFTDVAAVLEKRVHTTYNSIDDYGRYGLEKFNEGRRINTGDMRLDQYDFPSWETFYESTHYQMAGGCNGIVHEGRYQLAEFDKAVAKVTGKDRQHTPEELLKYHYAFLRGGTRPFGKYWGTAIYGQCDPSIAPKAVTLAYDMGARYVWYWTSDHDHHLPWVEQMELTRTLRKHAAEHPRPSIFARKVTLDKAIVIPYGYFLWLETAWAARILPPGDNEAAQKHRRVMQRVMAAVHEAFDRNEDFDIAVDDGREIAGYRKAVRITDE